MEMFPDTTTQPIFTGTWAEFHTNLIYMLTNPFVSETVLFGFGLVLLNLVLATLRRQGKPR